MTGRSYPPNIPDRIKEKLNILYNEIDQIESSAMKLIQTSMNEPVSIHVENQTMSDLLSDYERAQSISFVSRYENLPELDSVKIIQHQGIYIIGNMTYMRHILNEYRSIIQNSKDDSVYYQKVHNLCIKMLHQDDYRKGTKITVWSRSNKDITDKFIKFLGDHNKAIKFVLRPLAFDYIYNGILQHSDEHFSKRFIKEYMSGEINYIFWKHAYLLGVIRNLLRPYYMIMNAFSFPKLGPL